MRLGCCKYVLIDRICSLSLLRKGYDSPMIYFVGRQTQTYHNTIFQHVCRVPIDQTLLLADADRRLRCPIHKRFWSHTISCHACRIMHHIQFLQPRGHLDHSSTYIEYISEEALLTSSLNHLPHGANYRLVSSKAHGDS